ncbi:MAG: DUF2809 domain-containing protein [Pseudomonadota bacterium]
MSLSNRQWRLKRVHPRHDVHNTPPRQGLAGLRDGLVEASQLWQPPWLNAIRATSIGHLVLGQGFQWGDVLVYTCGVAIGVLAERAFARA